MHCRLFGSNRQGPGVKCYKFENEDPGSELQITKKGRTCWPLGERVACDPEPDRPETDIVRADNEDPGSELWSTGVEDRRGTRTTKPLRLEISIQKLVEGNSGWKFRSGPGGAIS